MHGKMVKSGLISVGHIRPGPDMAGYENLARFRPGLGPDMISGANLLFYACAYHCVLQNSTCALTLFANLQGKVVTFRRYEYYIYLSQNLVKFLTMKFIYWSISDKVTTGNTTAYIFAQLCISTINIPFYKSIVHLTVLFTDHSLAR